MALETLSPELLMMMSEMSKGNSNDNSDEFDETYDADFADFYDDDDDDDAFDYYDDDDDGSSDYFDDDDDDDSFAEYYDDDDSAELFGRRWRQRRRKRRLSRLKRRYRGIAKRAGVRNTTITSPSGKQVAVRLGRKFATEKAHNALVNSVNRRFSTNARDHNTIRRVTSANSRNLAKMRRDMKAAQQQAQMSSMMSLLMGQPKIEKIEDTTAVVQPSTGTASNGTVTIEAPTVTYEKNNLPLMMMMSGGMGGKSNNNMMPMMMALALA